MTNANHPADNSSADSLYAQAGVDTQTGDFAVELIKKSIQETYTKTVINEFGGFAGLMSVDNLKNFKKPLLASTTDGVGTKISIAKALGRHDTIGIDLVAMVLNDLITVGAKPLFLTDYIACGKIDPLKIAQIISGMSYACQETGTVLIGGETAEHPGVMPDEDYDLSANAVGVVEESERLGSHRVYHGDVIIALKSSGLHSNGYSLVRKIIQDNKIDLCSTPNGLQDPWGTLLLAPTVLYSQIMLHIINQNKNRSVHALAHVTGGGCAANLARIIPKGCVAKIDRSTWRVPPIIHALCNLAQCSYFDVENTWNMGVGMFVVVAKQDALLILNSIRGAGQNAWVAGEVILEKEINANKRLKIVKNTKGTKGGSAVIVNDYLA